ncbi:hypothetical protein PWP00_002376 [Enterococcus faecium]|nr:hypothetical protein [Enterococcus faecium]EME7121592.1 hypothetical protein [Enterococcus faecium]EME8104672.1 hypothetical protein [Enterococcus faecium]EME8145328.1 hypothetical protein [Enterococcus faecium]EME8200936.1 hypothetical protein [Enterococcus faecium]
MFLFFCLYFYFSF